MVSVSGSASEAAVYGGIDTSYSVGVGDSGVSGSGGTSPYSWYRRFFRRPVLRWKLLEKLWIVCWLWFEFEIFVRL